MKRHFPSPFPHLILTPGHTVKYIYGLYNLWESEQLKSEINYLHSVNSHYASVVFDWHGAPTLATCVNTVIMTTYSGVKHGNRSTAS